MKKQEIIESLRKKLFSAINRNDFQKVKECIEEAESEHIKNEVLNGIDDSMNPILLATKKHNLKILRLLIHKGGDVNLATSSTNYFSTPLHIAVADDELEIAQFLLDSDANINATNYKGFTPLYLASLHCRQIIVELLLCNNAATSIKDVNGKTALDVVGSYRRNTCDSDKRQKITAILNGTAPVDCSMLGFITITPKGDTTDVTSSAVNSSLAPIRTSEVGDTTDVTSSAVKPSSFINSMFSWVRASTTATLSSLFQSTPALPPAQQPVANSAESPSGSSQVDFCGTALLAIVAVNRLFGIKFLRPMNNSFLTLKQCDLKVVKS